MVKIIKEVSKKEFKDWLLKDINLTDQNLYTELNEDKSLNIFQFSGNTAEGLVKKINPKNFNEMVIVNAAARPGTIDFVPDYIKSRDEGVNKYPKQVQEVLKETAGVVFYQEQTMSIFNKIGDFTLQETNEVRALMKKLGKVDKKKADIDRWDEVVKKFEDGAIKKGLTKKEAEMVADDLLKLSAYSFNLSHAVAYTYIATTNLYLSYYFKPYYFSAILTYEAGREDTLKESLNKSKLQGFKILPPDINKSHKHFFPENQNTIRFGLYEIKGIGDKPIEKVLSSRPYTSLFDFMMKMNGKSLNRNTISALIGAGCFDELINKERVKNIFIVEQFIDKKRNIKIFEKIQATWDNVAKIADSIPGLETTENKLVEYEEQYYGFSFFNSLFTDKILTIINTAYRKGLCGRSFDDLKTYQISMPIPVIVDSLRVFNDKNGREMAFIQCIDINGKFYSIPIFQTNWKFVKDKIVAKTIFLINFYVSEEKQIMIGTKKFAADEEKRRWVRKLS